MLTGGFDLKKPVTGFKTNANGREQNRAKRAPLAAAHLCNLAYKPPQPPFSSS